MFFRFGGSRGFLRLRGLFDGFCSFCGLDDSFGGVGERRE